MHRAFDGYSVSKLHGEMKKLIIIILVISGIQPFFAQRMIDQHVEVIFFSEAPLEDIKAVNKQAMAVLDRETGHVAVSMLIRGFQFDKSLMQEHFNDNYMESDKFPKATFTGEILNYDPDSLISSEAIKRIVAGELTIHGVTRPLNAAVTFNLINDEVHVKTTFDVRLSDHEIKIPTLVIKNIAEEVEVTAEFTFEH